MALSASVEQLKELETSALTHHVVSWRSTDLSAELQQTSDLLRSEQSKTEKLQDFLQHAESDVEQLSNQLDEQKRLFSTLEAEKAAVSRQLSAARTGKPFGMSSKPELTPTQMHNAVGICYKKSRTGLLNSKRLYSS